MCKMKVVLRNRGIANTEEELEKFEELVKSKVVLKAKGIVKVKKRYAHPQQDTRVWVK